MAEPNLLELLGRVRRRAKTGATAVFLGRVGWVKKHPIRAILYPFDWVLQSFGLTSFYAFVHSGVYFFNQTWIVRMFWVIGLVLFIGHTAAWMIKSHREKFPFQWWPTTLVLAFSVMTYWLYIPSHSPRLAHREDQNELRQFLSDHEYDVDGLVHGAVRLYRHQEPVWSYLYFTAATNTQRAHLNQFYPFFISDLFQIGMDKAATNAANDMLAGIQSDFPQHWRQASDSNILGETLENTYEAAMPLTDIQKEFFKSKIRDELNADYKRSLTNVPPSQ